MGANDLEGLLKRGSPLSAPAILRGLKEGSIIIDPFVRRNLKTVSYDVTLGHYFWAETPAEPVRIEDDRIRKPMRNPYSERSARASWTLQAARPWNEWDEFFEPASGIRPNDLVYVLGPGKSVLGHTREFIGGRKVCTTSMHARSTVGRTLIEVCKCAGWGDIGYVNRWTMEITNTSEYYHVPLVVGRRLAQIAFFPVEDPGEDYASDGKYQMTSDLDRLKLAWTPDAMLPRMWQDRECNATRSRR